MVVPDGYNGALAGFSGAPSRPPTPTAVGNQRASVGGGVGQGAGFETPRPHLLPPVNGLPDPHGVPFPPLAVQGVPAPPPQLMGSLPFSVPTDTCHFGAPYNPALLNPDSEEAAPAASLLPPAAAPAAGAPTHSARVVASVDRTQLGGPSTALPRPVIASDGPDPLSTLLNTLPAPTLPGTPRPEPSRAGTGAFVRPPQATAPGGRASAGAPTIGVAPPPLPPPPMVRASPSPGSRRVSAPRTLSVASPGGRLPTVGNGTAGLSAVGAATARATPVRAAAARTSPPIAPSASTQGAAPSAARSVPAGASGARASPGASPPAGARGGDSGPRLDGSGASGNAREGSGQSAARSGGQQSKKGKARKGTAAQDAAAAAGSQRAVPAMTPTLGVNKLHDGTPVLSDSGYALAHAVSVGLRPMRLDVNSASASVEELNDNLNGFGQQLQTQGKVLEQLAKTVHALKADANAGINDIKHKIGLDKGDVDAIKADLKVAKINQAELVRIRNRLRAYSKEETAKTELTRRVYLNADHYLDLMHMAIEDELMLNEEDARVYAMSRKVYPARKSKTTSMRVRSLLMRSRSHTLQAYKETIIPVYFEHIGVFSPAPRSKNGKRRRQSGTDLQVVADLMDKATAEEWLNDLTYITSEEGYPAMLATLKQFMIMLGAETRVVASKNVGGGEYVDCTVGHVSIVCAIIRGELEKAAGIKPQRRTGLAGGIYTEFAAEVPRVDECLPMHDLPARGLRLVDGGDDDRGQLAKDEYVEAPEILEEEALDMAAFDAGLVDAMEDMES